jgi:hypothetical protein
MPNEILQHDDETNELARVAPSVPVQPTGTTAQTANGLSQHTPGPWEVQDGIMVVSSALKGKLHFTDTEGVAHCAEKGLIALVYACHPEGEWRAGTSDANANLIAAAPDLLAALKALLEWHREEYQSNRDIDARAKAAIQKAEGRS